MSRWPAVKTARSMGHYRQDDIPFQFALAEAFTICDAYHCSIQSGTNSNRLFLWSGTNDLAGRAGGPAIGNSHNSLVANGGHPEGYRWTTYVAVAGGGDRLAHLSGHRRQFQRQPARRVPALPRRPRQRPGRCRPRSDRARHDHAHARPVAPRRDGGDAAAGVVHRRRRRTIDLAPGETTQLLWPIAASSGWYDLVVRTSGDPIYSRRFAGRIETGLPSISNPAMHGPAAARHLL